MTVGMAENPSNPHVTFNEVTNAIESVNCAGSSDVTLTDDQVNNAGLILTGALTGNINLVVPQADHIYRVYNNTSGAYTVTVKSSSTASPAPATVVVAQGKAAILGCDGSDVFRYTDDTA